MASFLVIPLAMSTVSYYTAEGLKKLKYQTHFVLRMLLAVQ